MGAHGLACGLRGSVVVLGAGLVLAAACGEDPEEPQGTLDAAISVPEAAVAAPGPGGGATPSGTAGGVDASAAGGAPSGTAAMNGGAGGIFGGLRDSGITFPPFGRDAGSRDAGAGGGAIDNGAPVPVGDGGADPYAEVRQICVETINMYRATMNLPPIMRANPTLEACSDMGAKYDGDMNKGHASTQVPGKGPGGMGAGRLCGSPSLGRQNTCPGWGVGPRTGNATLADAIKKCLAQMWAENEPPQGVQACEQSYRDRTDTACFLMHGHWINMTRPATTAVSCGFYDMGGGKYWMNQDFVGG